MKIDYKPGEYVVVRGHPMMLEIHSIYKHNAGPELLREYGDKIRLRARDHGTFDTGPDNVRRLQRGDIISCWESKIVAEVIARRESDGYYLLVNKDDPEATSCYLRPNSHTELRSEF